MNSTGEYDGDDIPDAVRRAVLERDDYKCRSCGNDEELTLHHVIFRSGQGTHDPNNLVTLCMRCHTKIHNRKMYVKRIHGMWYFTRPHIRRQ